MRAFYGVPAVVLPPKTSASKPREAWVQRAESLLDAIERAVTRGMNEAARRGTVQSQLPRGT